MKGCVVCHENPGRGGPEGAGPAVVWAVALWLAYQFYHQGSLGPPEAPGWTPPTCR